MTTGVTPEDPITVEIIGNSLQAIAEEMGAVLIRASYSSNIKERRDCSTGILSARGEIIAQAEHIPLHLGSLLGVVEATLANFASDEICGGDVFVANDPYLGGGTHLPDIAMATPFFHGGRLLAFVANIAHHSEVGGRLGAGEDVWEEGLRIPPIRLVRNGQIDEQMLRLLLANMRIPSDRRGDFEAQIASMRIGIQRLMLLCERYGQDVLLSSVKELSRYAERRIRTAIAAIPDGTYEFLDFVEDDGVTDEPIPIRVSLQIVGDRVTCDFRGSGPQTKGPINVPASALRASVYYALKAGLDPDIPPNAGFYKAIEIVTTEGSVLNPRPPAPVLKRSDTCQRVVDVIFGALAHVVPDKVIAACSGVITGPTLVGILSASRQFYVYDEVIAGGFGARYNEDGVDGVQVHMTNTSNLPVECLEDEFPIRVDRYEFAVDTGGAGRFRGGLGVVREIRMLENGARLDYKGDRFRIAPWGLLGGRPGGVGALTINPGTHGEIRLGSKSTNISLKAGDVVRMQSPGSGGYGDPLSRDPERIACDVREGKVSRQEARQAYGVVLDSHLSVVESGTCQLRTELSIGQNR